MRLRTQLSEPWDTLCAYISQGRNIRIPTPSLPGKFYGPNKKPVRRILLSFQLIIWTRAAEKIRQMPSSRYQYEAWSLNFMQSHEMYVSLSFDAQLLTLLIVHLVEVVLVESVWMRGEVLWGSDFCSQLLIPFATPTCFRLQRKGGGPSTVFFRYVINSETVM